MLRKIFRMWPMFMFCAGAWFFGGLMIYLAITEGPNIPLLIAGIISAAVPFVFIIAGLLVSGIIPADGGGIGLLEMAFGMIAAGFGVLFIYAIGDSFSPIKALQAGGAMAVLPLIFLTAGVFMIIRGFFRK